MPRVAVVQSGPVAYDIPATLDKFKFFTRWAATDRAQLVLFPEAFLTGYPKGLDFGARVGLRTAEGRKAFRRYFESAITVPGPETEAIGACARENRVYVVIGVVEREGSTLYCTVLFFGPNGKLMGKRRKLMPTGTERVIWGCGDGSTLQVFDTPIGKLGAVICWENYMPLLRTAMYAKGIQLYCAPTVYDKDSNLPTMRHIAMEGRCFVLCACQYARKGDYPPDYPTVVGQSGPIVIRGGSGIVAPNGDWIVGPIFDEEIVLTADVDLEMITEWKYDFDVTGHYARPDVFRLTVNEAATPAVVSGTGSPTAIPYSPDEEEESEAAGA
jgi:nitrilase